MSAFSQLEYAKILRDQRIRDAENAAIARASFADNTHIHECFNALVSFAKEVDRLIPELQKDTRALEFYRSQYEG